MQDEMKSVTSEGYGLFISKHKDDVSAEVLLSLQDMYYLKPLVSDREMQEMISVASDGEGISLYRSTKGKEIRYRLMVIEYGDKVQGFKINTLYGV